ncbi:hypothetical protein EON65_56445 [archaeon]|nr:MAG: hypothetical protein EON65_56445 [archaeon]
MDNTEGLSYTIQENPNEVTHAIPRIMSSMQILSSDVHVAAVRGRSVDDIGEFVEAKESIYI